jgi:hypothetical protein
MEYVEVDSQIDFVVPLEDDAEYFDVGEGPSGVRAEENVSRATELSQKHGSATVDATANSPWRSMLARPGDVLRSLLPSSQPACPAGLNMGTMWAT